MSAERKKVLEMLAAGKITAEDAERLLDKLSGTAGDQTGAREKVAAGPATEPKKHRYLRILVERPGQDQVNVRLPLSFTRTWSGLLAVLPHRVGERLAEYGIDLSGLAALNDAEFAKAIDELNVDVERGDGKKVRIYCE